MNRLRIHLFNKIAVSSDDSLSPRRVSSIPGHIAVTSSTAASAVAWFPSHVAGVPYTAGVSFVAGEIAVAGSLLVTLLAVADVFCYYMSPPRLLSSLLLQLLLPAGVLTTVLLPKLLWLATLRLSVWCCYYLLVLCVLGENAELTPLSLWDSIGLCSDAHSDNSTANSLPIRKIQYIYVGYTSRSTFIKQLCEYNWPNDFQT